MNFIELFPKELSMLIISFLNAEDLFILQQVSKEWREICKDDILWKKIYCKNWNSKRF